MIKKFLLGFLVLCMVTITGCTTSNTNHKWGSWVANTDGVTHTRVCEKDFMHSETNNHNFNISETVKEATDVQNGIVKYKCSVCGYEKQEVIKPTGSHNFSLEIAEPDRLKHSVSSATAVYYKSCADCGAYGNEDYLFEKTNLPEEYLEMEYIASNGNEYIDTGFKANEKSRIVIKTSYTSCYSVYGGTPGHFNFTAKEPSIGYFYSGGYDNGMSKQVDLSRKIHVFDQNRTNVYVDGELFHTFSYKKWQDKNNLFLFARNNNGFINDAGGVVKIYACQLYDDDVLIRDFVPVLNVNTNKVGFYDLVTQKFFTNSYGFSAGELTEQQTLPSQYEQVSYIEGRGEQFIDTGISFTDKPLEIDVDFEFNALKRYSTILGTQVAETNLLLRESEGTLTYYYGQGSTEIEPAEIGKRYNLNLKTTTENWSYSGNCGEAEELKENVLRNNLPIYLFDSCLNVAGQRGSKAYSEISSDAKLYGCKITQDSVLVRNFVPCIRKLDGLAGLYDTVSGNFFTYTNNFTFGNNTGEIINNRYAVVDYLESNGNQYIDTGYVPNSGDITIKMKGQFKNPNVNQSWFGADEVKVALNASHTYGMWQFGANNTFYNVTDSSCDLNLHEIEYYYGSNQYLKIDGETKFSNAEQAVYAKNSLTIFCNSGTYTDGVMGEQRYFVDGKLYYFQIYNNDVLIKNFVPCFDLITMEAGLYDLVGEKFYSNQYGGGFSSGEIAGHYFDEGTVVTQTSHEHDGHTVYKCKICGREINKYEEAYAYKLTFDLDENITELKVYKDYNPENYETTVVAYSRNLNTFNYSKVNSAVIISVTVKEGYELNLTAFEGVSVTKLPDGRLVIYNIHTSKEILLTTTLKTNN